MHINFIIHVHSCKMNIIKCELQLVLNIQGALCIAEIDNHQ